MDATRGRTQALKEEEDGQLSSSLLKVFSSTTSLPCVAPPESYLEILPYPFLRGLSSTSTSSAAPLQPPRLLARRALAGTDTQRWGDASVRPCHSLAPPRTERRVSTGGCRWGVPGDALPRVRWQKVLILLANSRNPHARVDCHHDTSGVPGSSRQRARSDSCLSNQR